jgi:hypothetical protein
LNQNCQVARKKSKRNNSISDPPYPPLKGGIRCGCGRDLNF